MRIIPFPGQASFSEEITLENKVYRFRFDWNTSGQYWSMSIYNRDLELLVSGIKIVLDYELISDYAYMGLPEGEIYAMDTSNELLTIGRNDIGDRVFLAYVESSEL